MSNVIQPMSFEVPDKDVESKIYIVLYSSPDFHTDVAPYGTGIFGIYTGREAAYTGIHDAIKNDPEFIDIDKSIVLVETKQQTKNGDMAYFITNPNNSLSIRRFVETVFDKLSIETQHYFPLDDIMELSYDEDSTAGEHEEDSPMLIAEMDETEKAVNFYNPVSSYYDQEGEDV